MKFKISQIPNTNSIYIEQFNPQTGKMFHTVLDFEQVEDYDHHNYMKPKQGGGYDIRHNVFLKIHDCDLQYDKVST